MRKQTFLRCALASIFCLTSALAQAQTGISTNAYQIVSGQYTICCGIAGPFHYDLPNPSQSFVLLIIDHDLLRARMSILRDSADDIAEFRVLENGRVHPGYIEFGVPGLPPPIGGLPVIHYIVSNSAAGLRFNGIVLEPRMGADRLYQFTHTNVVAVPLISDTPAATIRMSEVEICWPSLSTRAYEVQYRSSLTSNTWTSLGNPVAGNGSTNCVADKVPPGEPRRFYRVINAF